MGLYPGGVGVMESGSPGGRGRDLQLGVFGVLIQGP